jgi:hypothetical protein
MNARLSLRLLAALVGFALSAFAQIDGAGLARDLRAKYGPPLARETFTVWPGTEMVVDYAANGHVCRIQLPPTAPGREPGVRTPQAVDDFLAELLPLQVRGKELRRMSEAYGRLSVSRVEFENVVIAETIVARTRTGVIVTFTKEECRDRPSQ